jgi:hypothetical protein
MQKQSSDIIKIEIEKGSFIVVDRIASQRGKCAMNSRKFEMTSRDANRDIDTDYNLYMTMYNHDARSVRFVQLDLFLTSRTRVLCKSQICACKWSRSE